MPLVSVPAVYDSKEVRLLEPPPVQGQYRVVVTFDVSSSGSRFEFTRSLTDDDVLSGDFSLTAWVVVKDAVLGNWLIRR